MIGLFLFPQMFFRSIGMGGLAVVLVAVTLALTLLPALLAVLGPHIDAFRVPFAAREAAAGEETSGFWHRVAFGVMKRPILTIIGVGGPLLLLGSPFLKFEASIPDYHILPEGNPVRAAAQQLDVDFMPFQATPHEVVVRTEGRALTRPNLEALYALGERIAAVPGVAQVDSVFTLRKGISKQTLIDAFCKPEAEQDSNVRAALAAFTREDHMRFSVVSTVPFNNRIALAQVAALRATTPPPGGRVMVGGATAVLLDLKHDIDARAPGMVLLVGIAMFIVLFLVFGSITLPIKAMLMNSLSLTASFGAIVWVFQEGRFEGVLHYKSLHISDATQPIIMFAIVFGLSMDYEVLLLCRVREEFLRTGDNTLAVARGLARTGRLITSAASLLVVVTAAFATSEIIVGKTLGVGMALAIAIDATVVRALLVPATMRLMGSWNWYAPQPLLALWQRLGLSDLEGHSEEREAHDQAVLARARAAEACARTRSAPVTDIH